MPGFNGRGPQGEGPLTGRRQGRCQGNNPRGGSMGYGIGFGRGGHGRGTFYGHGYGAGMGYRAHFGATEFEEHLQAVDQPAPHFEQAELNQQLSTVIKQLSILLDRWESGAKTNEKS